MCAPFQLGALALRLWGRPPARGDPDELPGLPLKGRVDSLGWGISPDDGTTGYELLPEISATFEWIRLAQRVPVRIHLEDVPDEVKLRRGTTASVVVLTGTAGSEPDGGTPALPRALQ